MTSGVALADPMIEVAPLAGSAGPQGSWGQCPCYRWTATLKMVSGEIETRDFLITTDAIVRVDSRQTLDFARVTQLLFRAGAMELLWKGGHLGLNFDGVQVGGDLDRGYTDIVRVGGQGILNFLYNENFRLDLRAGYRYETFDYNLGEAQKRESLPVSVHFRGENGPWSAYAGFTAAPDRRTPLSAENLLLRAEAGFAAELVSQGRIRANLNFDAYVERDFYRGDTLALETDNVAALLSLELRWVPPIFTTKEDRR